MEMQSGSLTSLALALGIGLLIGVERERRKGHGPRRAFAGVRSFTLVALMGGLLQWLNQVWLVALAGGLVVTLAAIAYWRDRSRDPGITTELALFVTFVLGVLTVPYPAVAAAGGVVVVALLAGREPLQHFSTRTLSAQELRDALVLAAAGVLVLRLTPYRSVTWLVGVIPRAVWYLVVLFLGVQGLGKVALRVFGAGLGLPLSGLVGGFVSSTATIAAVGARAARHVELRRACVAAAWFSTVATAVQVLLIVLVLSPVSLPVLAPSMGSALCMALLLGVAALTRQSTPVGGPMASERAFSLVASLGLAGVLSGITAAVAYVQGAWGAPATLGAIALAGLADLHAASAAVIQLHAQGGVDASTLLLAVLLAFSTNSLSKVMAAYAAGGWQFGTRVSLGLLLVALAAWLPWVVPRLW